MKRWCRRLYWRVFSVCFGMCRALKRLRKKTDDHLQRGKEERIVRAMPRTGIGKKACYAAYVINTYPSQNTEMENGFRLWKSITMV